MTKQPKKGSILKIKTVMAVMLGLVGVFMIVSPASATAYTSSFSSVVIPQYSASNGVATISGKLLPAVADRSVSVNMVANANGDSPVFKIGTETDAQGNFSVSFPTDYVRYYQLYAAGKTVGSNTYSSAKSSASQIRSLRFWDSFDTYGGSTANLINAGKYYLRGTEYGGPHARPHNKSDWSAVSIVNNSLKIGLVRDGTAADGLAQYESAQLGLNFLTQNVPYGHFEAGIRFGQPKGAHGALWSISDYGSDGTNNGGEFDIAESFGSNPSATTHRVQTTMYWNDAPVQFQCFNTWDFTVGTDKGQCPTSGESQKALNGASSFYNTSHTYAGTWIASGYSVAVDNVAAGSLTTASGLPYISNQPAEHILSLVVGDDELDDIAAHLAAGGSLDDYTMYVDWVRVWR